jgi:hypothetical protein
MISLQRETVNDIMSDAGALLLANNSEAVGEDFKLCVDWPRYGEIEASGALEIFTVRDDDKLTGYAVFFVVPHLHYAENIFALCDTIYIDPKHRQSAVKLFRYAEQELKLVGVEKIMLTITLRKNFLPLAKYLGYSEEEIVVSKRI